MTMPTTIVDDPEKGTLEVVLPTVPVLSQPSQDSTVNSLSRPAADEKKVADITVVPAMVPTSKHASAAQKPKRKVSRWIQLQLWFNTYR